MRTRVVLVIAAFTVVMAGPNLPTPLYPAYRAGLGLPAFGLTVLVGVYLVVLVPVLLSAGWAARRWSPRALLVAGLTLSAAADACLAFSPTVGGIVAGRVLSAGAVGLSTGAATVLLRHHGRLRSASTPAVCTVLGSAAGTAFTAVLAEYLPQPTRLAYVAHALIGLACAGSLVAARALARPRRADTGRGAGGGTVIRPGEAGRFAIACGAGLAAWVTAGLIVSLVPTYAHALLHATNLVVSAGPVVAFLTAAGLGSIVAGRRPPRAELAVAPILMAAGLALTASSGPAHATAVLFLGAAITGTGQGLGFRGGLASALRAAAPARQAVASSRYSACAYLGAAAITLGMGLLTDRVGLDAAFRYAAVLFGAGAVVLAVLAYRRFGGPRLSGVGGLPGGEQRGGERTADAPGGPAETGEIHDDALVEDRDP